MTREHLLSVLRVAQAKKDDKEDSWALPEGTSLTFYVAHGGVGLSIARIEAVWMEGPIWHARIHSGKRETFLVHHDDIYAAAIEGGPGAAAKRAGF